MEIQRIRRNKKKRLYGNRNISSTSKSSSSDSILINNRAKETKSSLVCYEKYENLLLFDILGYISEFSGYYEDVDIMKNDENKKKKVAEFVESVIGCKIVEYFWFLLSKMRNGMTFENYKKLWKIDYILPIKSTYDAMSRSFHKREKKDRLKFYTHQPLWTEEYAVKFDKYYEREITFDEVEKDGYNPIPIRKFTIYYTNEPIIINHSSTNSKSKNKDHVYENLISYSIKNFPLKLSDYTSLLYTKHVTDEIRNIMKDDVEILESKTREMKSGSVDDMVWINHIIKKYDYLLSENISNTSQSDLAIEDKTDKLLHIMKDKVNHMTKVVDNFLEPKVPNGMSCGHFVIQKDKKDKSKCAECHTILETIKSIIYNKMYDYFQSFSKNFEIEDGFCSFDDDKKGKNGKWIWWMDLLGCSLEDYHRYLTSMFDYTMTWEGFSLRSERLWTIGFINLPPTQKKRKSTKNWKVGKSAKELHIKDFVKYFHYTNTMPVKIISKHRNKKIKEGINKRLLSLNEDFISRCMNHKEEDMRAENLKAIKKNCLKKLCQKYEERSADNAEIVSELEKLRSMPISILRKYNSQTILVVISNKKEANTSIMDVKRVRKRKINDRGQVTQSIKRELQVPGHHNKKKKVEDVPPLMDIENDECTCKQKELDELANVSRYARMHKKLNNCDKEVIFKMKKVKSANKREKGYFYLPFTYFKGIPFAENDPFDRSKKISRSMCAEHFIIDRIKSL